MTMASRRPLTVGVNAPENTDPEAVRAFITQERPRPRETEPEVPTQPITRETASSPAPKRKKHGKLTPVGLIPVTIRLRPEIAGALKRASLERQLAGEDLFTQQDIVEQVLEPWLASEGHLN